MSDAQGPGGKHETDTTQIVFPDVDEQLKRDARSIVEKLNSGEVRFVSNFDGDKMQQWRLMSLATGGGTLSFEDMPLEGIDLKYYFCHRVEMVSQGGEVIEPIRTAMIDKQGKCYGFVSDFIARELDTLIQVWGNGPWTEPMKIKVVRFKTRKGQQCYSIKPAE